MTLLVWIYVISRMAICISAGEICIRYTAWSWLLLKKRPPFPATPIIFGVAILTFARCNIEGRWISLLAIPSNAATFVALDANDIHSAISRFILIVGLFSLAYPALKLQYGSKTEAGLVAFLVRAFLCISCACAGWIGATIYYFHP